MSPCYNFVAHFVPRGAGNNGALGHGDDADQELPRLLETFEGTQTTKM
jgi:hypothetical protein